MARALATEPRLLLLDEAMAGLRPTEIDQMVAVFRRLNEEHGLTIVLIEHVMRPVMALSREIHVLHHGADVDIFTVAQSIHVDLGGVLKEPVDEHRVPG